MSTVLPSFPAPQPASFIFFCFPFRLFFFQFFARVTRISEQNDRCFIAHEESVSASLSCDRPRNATISTRARFSPDFSWPVRSCPHFEMLFLAKSRPMEKIVRTIVISSGRRIREIFNRFGRKSSSTALA